MSGSTLITCTTRIVEPITWTPGGTSSTNRLDDSGSAGNKRARSEEHTSELQSLRHLVCRLVFEKKNLNMTVPQVGQRPLMALRPFFMHSSPASAISFFALHCTRCPSAILRCGRSRHATRQSMD